MKHLVLYVAVLYVTLLTLFGLLSGAESGAGLSEIIANLPNALPWILGWVAVALAWKKPRIGGALFIVLGLASIVFFHSYESLVTFLIVSLPLFIFGWLFIRKQKTTQGD